MVSNFSAPQCEECGCLICKQNGTEETSVHIAGNTFCSLECCNDWLEENED